MLPYWQCDARDKDNVQVQVLEDQSDDEENLDEDTDSQTQARTDESALAFDQLDSNGTQIGVESNTSLDEGGENLYAAALAKQQELQEQDNISRENAKALSALSKYGFIVTAENLEQLQVSDDGKDLATIPLSVDLLSTPGNFAAALEHGLANAYKNGEYQESIKAYIKQFLDLVKTQRETIKSSQIDNMVSKLDECYELMSKKSSKISKEDAFFQFITAMQKIAQIREARNNAIVLVKVVEQMVLHNMLNTEKKLSGTLSFSTTIDGVKVGGEIGIAKKTGRDSDFGDAPFRIAKQTSGKLSIGVNFGILEALAKVVAAREKSQMFFSVISYLLDPKLGKGLFTDSKIKSASNGLKNLQDLEKKGIANVALVFRYLKGIGCIPESIHEVFPVLTKAKSTRRAKSHSIALGAEMKLLSKLGVKAEVERQAKDTRREITLMSLVDKSFSPAQQKYDAKGIINIIGEKYNCSKIISETEIILQDLNEYLEALRTLSLVQSDQKIKIDRESKKTARRKKSAIEQKWRVKGAIKSEGREGILRAVLCTMVALAESKRSETTHPDKKELERRSEIYSKLHELCAFQEFSKNKHNTRGAYEEYLKTKFTALTSTVECNVPALGIFAANVKLFLDKDRQLQKVHLWFDAPLAGIGLAADSVIRALTNIGDKLDNANKGSGHNLRNTLKLLCIDALQPSFGPLFIKTVLAKTLKLGTPISGAKLLALTSLTNNSHVRIEMSRIPDYDGDQEPLPKETKLMEKKSNFAIQRIEVHVDSNIKSDLVTPTGTPLFIGQTTTDKSILLGDNTFEEWKSFYHQATLSEEDMKTLNEDQTSSMSDNSLWSAYLAQHEKALKKLLINIAARKPNAIYELQCMYNEMLNTKKKPEAEVTQIVQTLMDKCTKLKLAVSNENGLFFDNATDLYTAYTAAQASLDSISKEVPKEELKENLFKELLDTCQNLCICIDAYTDRPETPEEKAQAIANICASIGKIYEQLQADEATYKKSSWRKLFEDCSSLVEAVNEFRDSLIKGEQVNLNTSYTAVQVSFANLPKKYQKKLTAAKELLETCQKLFVSVEEYRDNPESPEEKAQEMAAICDDIGIIYSKLQKEIATYNDENCANLLEYCASLIKAVNNLHMEVNKDFDKALRSVPRLNGEQADINTTYVAVQESFEIIPEKYKNKLTTAQEFLDASRNLFVTAEEYRDDSESPDEKAQKMVAICDNIDVAYNKLQSEIKKDKSLCRRSCCNKFLEDCESLVDAVTDFRIEVKKDFDKALRCIAHLKNWREDLNTAYTTAQESFESIPEKYQKKLATAQELLEACQKLGVSAKECRNKPEALEEKTQEIVAICDNIYDLHKRLKDELKEDEAICKKSGCRKFFEDCERLVNAVNEYHIEVKKDPDKASRCVSLQKSELAKEEAFDAFCNFLALYDQLVTTAKEDESFSPVVKKERLLKRVQTTFKRATAAGNKKSELHS